MKSHTKTITATIFLLLLISFIDNSVENSCIDKGNTIAQCASLN